MVVGLSTAHAPARTTAAHRQAVEDEVAGKNTGGRPVVTALLKKVFGGENDAIYSNKL